MTGGSNKTGLFIVLEGGEGVGKSTNLAFIQRFLADAGIAFDTSREPGGTELAEQIRELVLSHHCEPMGAMTELLLIFAARAQHLQQKIRPVLADGKWMVCDRFTDATYAYQGGGRQLGKQRVAELEQFVQGDLRPDYVILLDAPVEVGQARAKERADLDRMESENLDFHQRVRDSYLERAQQTPKRYCVIDASRPLEAVQADIASRLGQMVEQWRNE